MKPHWVVSLVGGSSLVVAICSVAHVDRWISPQLEALGAVAIAVLMHAWLVSRWRKAK